MTKACGRCGRIHPANYKCNVGKVYAGGDERKLRATNKWHEKSKQIREEAQYLCEVCRDKGRYVYKDLEVHHIEKLTDHPELLLEDDNLICLCQQCHKEADSGKLSKEYLQAVAGKRRGIPPLPL